MDRTRYQVLATQCDGWWAVEIAGVPGAMTTAHSLTGIEESARDLLAGLLGVARSSFDLDLAFSPNVLPHPRSHRTPAEQT